MKYIIFLFMLFLLVSLAHYKSQMENLYVIYTDRGEIYSTYHNSRDLNNGWMEYYGLNGKRYHIPFDQVDSIKIIKEDWLTCGPRGKVRYFK